MGGGHQRQRKRFSEALRDRCLNCLSFTHRIVTCRRPLRCMNYHSTRHMARDCKRPRSPVHGTGGENPARDHFVRARRGPESDGTPAASQASGSTPPISNMEGRPRGPTPDDRDPLPRGHPEERPWESACIIQRNAAIDSTETGLRLAVSALIADGTRVVSIADAYGVLRGIQGSRRAHSPSSPFTPRTFSLSVAPRRRGTGSSVHP